MTSRQLQAGLTGGLTRPGPRGTTFQLRGPAQFTDGETAGGGDRIGGSRLDGDLSATFGRKIPVVGSVRIEPMAGAYVALQGPLPQTGTGQFADARVGPVSTEFGVRLPVRFRVLGVDVALTPGLRLTGVGWDGSSLLPRRSYGPVPGTGSRLDF